MDSPYETNTLYRFMPVIPRELILFDSLTGRVLARRSRASWKTDAESTMDSGGTPFRIKIAFKGTRTVRIDGGEPRSVRFGEGVAYARDPVDVSVSGEFDMRGLKLQVNDQPFEPEWNIVRRSYGSFESASFSILAEK